MKFFHLDQSQNISGPYSRKALIRKLTQGKLSSTGHVLEDGSETWIDAQEFCPGLSSTGEESDFSTSDSDSGSGIPQSTRFWIVVGVVLIAAVCGSVALWKAGEQDDPIAQDKTSHDPLSEWYLLGYEQGSIIASASRKLGISSSAGRNELVQILGGLGVQQDSVPPEALQLCLQGFGDAVEGNDRAFALPESQTTSLLPTPFKGLFFPSDEPVFPDALSDADGPSNPGSQSDAPGAEIATASDERLSPIGVTPSESNPPTSENPSSENPSSGTTANQPPGKRLELSKVVGNWKASESPSPYVLLMIEIDESGKAVVSYAVQPSPGLAQFDLAKEEATVESKDGQLSLVMREEKWILTSDSDSEALRLTKDGSPTVFFVLRRNPS